MSTQYNGGMEKIAYEELQSLYCSFNTYKLTSKILL